MHRAETGTERQRPWWLQAIMSQDGLAPDYVKAHARKVADAMTRQVITASPETSLQDIAALLEKHAIKRVPIVENGHSSASSAARTSSKFRQRRKYPGHPAGRFRDSQQAAVALERAELGAHRPRQRHDHRRRGRSLGHCSRRFGTQGHSRGRRSNSGRAGGERQHQDLAAQCGILIDTELGQPVRIAATGAAAEDIEKYEGALSAAISRGHSCRRTGSAGVRHHQHRCGCFQ